MEEQNWKVYPADMQPIEAPSCADEPIHLPGSIQRHGFLLVLDEAGERVIAASRNAEEFLQVPFKLLLGTPLSTVLDREILAVVRSLQYTTDSEGMLLYLGAFHLKGDLCSLVTHIVDGYRILEFETLDRLVVPEIMNAVITNFVGKLSRIGTSLELCQAITRQMAELTGFDRVLLYSFDDAGHGTVLAEENNGALPSYLDLRFPATDIPDQARRLYVLNTVRIIPDASYTPSPIAGLADRSMQQLDLSQSILRSVSPVHLEYMRNMGTMSSMSVSIVCEGKLWGLISGHHAQPRTVPYLVRSACDMLTKMVGTQLAAFRNSARLERLVHFHTVQRELLTSMAAEANFVQALTDSMEQLQAVVGAAGAVVVVGDILYRHGEVPDDAAVRRLTDELSNRTEADVFVTSRLGEEIAWAAGIREQASGLIAIRTSDVRRNYILWFRPEVVRTVRWAGEPVKYSDPQQRLHPRSSFEGWKEKVVGQSEPWTDVEIESARDFRGALITITLRRAEEAAELSEARFQKLTHALPALVWTANDLGELTYVNERWRELGLEPEGNWFDVAHLNEDDRQRVTERWAQAVQHDEPFEEEVRTFDERSGERWHLVRAVPFQSAGRTRAGWVGTFTDTTDRRQREAALRMTEKLATTGRMTSVIAHEINNPLESITNLMFLLRGESSGNGPALDYISLAESELDRISGITKQTLRWGRERNEKVEEITPRAMFDDVLRLFAGKLRNREVALSVDGDLDVTFSAVPGQIRQVVANLLSNAIDAVPVGGSVWLRANARQETMLLVVKDAGSGITAEQKRKLFEPFFSTKGDLGNGLGLYISQEIVERHHGKLLVDTQVGSGTEMTVALPLRPATLIEGVPA